MGKFWKKKVQEWADATNATEIYRKTVNRGGRNTVIRELIISKYQEIPRFTPIIGPFYAYFSTSEAHYYGQLVRSFQVPGTRDQLGPRRVLYPQRAPIMARGVVTQHRWPAVGFPLSCFLFPICQLPVQPPKATGQSLGRYTVLTLPSPARRSLAHMR